MRNTKLEKLAAVVVGTLLFAGGTTIVTVAKPSPASAAERPPTPAVREARMQRLRSATLAVIIYVNRNDSHFPNDLGASLQYADKKLGARTFVTPDDERVAEVPEHASASWVNEHTSFVYLANGNVTWKTLDAEHVNTPEFPLACEKLEGHEGQDVAISFIDGHAEWMPLDQARKLIDDAKIHYARMGRNSS